MVMPKTMLPGGVLPREKLIQAALKYGGTVLLNGRRYKPDNLPPEEEMAAGDPERMARVRETVQREIADRIDRLARMGDTSATTSAQAAAPPGMVPEDEALAEIESRDREIARLKGELASSRKTESPAIEDNPKTEETLKGADGVTDSTAETTTEPRPQGRGHRPNR